MLLAAAMPLALFTQAIGAQVGDAGTSAESSLSNPVNQIDLSDLQNNWWPTVFTEDADVLKQRLDELNQRIQASVAVLQEPVLAEAAAEAKRIDEAGNELLSSLKTADTVPEDPLQARDEYPLSAYLDLLEKRDTIRRDNQLIKAELDQLSGVLRRQTQALEKLQGDYRDSDRGSASRILLALKQIDHRIRMQSMQLEAAGVRLRSERGIEQLAAVDDSISYASDHLVASPDADAELGKLMSSNEKATQTLDKQREDQRQALLDLLASDKAGVDDQTRARIQLTLTGSQQALNQLEHANLEARSLWEHLQEMQSESAPDGESESEEEASVSHETIIERSRALIDRIPELLDQTEEEAGAWQDVAEAAILLPTVDSEGKVNPLRTQTRELAQQVISNIASLPRYRSTLEILRELLVEALVSHTEVEQSLLTRAGILYDEFKQWLTRSTDQVFFTIGSDTEITYGSILKFITIVLIGYLISRFVRFLTSRMGKRRHIARSSGLYTFGRIMHYLIMTLAIFFGLTAMGLDFSNFALIAGALSVGIGFGLQSIVNNFVSGLIILFERTISVGDFIELGEELRGTVKEINTRSTIINTNDNYDVVVPNSELISNRLINWTLREPFARVRVPFGVAYGSDTARVTEAALEAAAEVDFTLTHAPGREPEVFMTGFGDSSLDFELLVWLGRNGVRRPSRVRSAYLFMLEKKFNEYGIEVPFPQRDLNLKTGFATALSESDT